MIEKIIKTFISGMAIDSQFDEKQLTLTTQTSFHGRVIYTHTADLKPMFQAFSRRVKKEKP